MIEDKVSVRIPRAVYEKIKQQVKASQGEFQSVEEYITFVLEGVLGEDEVAEHTYAPQEEEEIKKRLRNLGYL